MDFIKSLEIGETYIREFVVKPEDTAAYIGNKGITMLSTPTMIKYMEITAAQIVLKNLPENFRPVGTKIDVEHVNPTPVGMKVTVKATLTEVEGKKLRFDVEAFNDKAIIGFGIYEQHVINTEKFLEKHS